MTIQIEEEIPQINPGDGVHWVPMPMYPDDRHLRAIDAYEALGRAIATTTPPCDGDDRYIRDDTSQEDRLEMQDICTSRCTVRRECLAYFEKASPSAGIWAGLHMGDVMTLEEYAEWEHERRRRAPTPDPKTFAASFARIKREYG